MRALSDSEFTSYSALRAHQMLDVGYWIPDKRRNDIFLSIQHPASSFIRYPASGIQYHFGSIVQLIAPESLSKKRKFLYNLVKICWPS
jgi:hypothetical protein